MYLDPVPAMWAPGHHWQWLSCPGPPWTPACPRSSCPWWRSWAGWCSPSRPRPGCCVRTSTASTCDACRWPRWSLGTLCWELKNICVNHRNCRNNFEIFSNRNYFEIVFDCNSPHPALLLTLRKPGPQSPECLHPMTPALMPILFLQVRGWILMYLVTIGTLR